MKAAVAMVVVITALMTGFGSFAAAEGNASGAAEPGTSHATPTAAAFANRLNKASLAIRNLLRTPDILAVEELQNVATIQALATKINTDAVSAGQARRQSSPDLS